MALAYTRKMIKCYDLSQLKIEKKTSNKRDQNVKEKTQFQTSNLRVLCKIMLFHIDAYQRLRVIFINVGEKIKFPKRLAK
jgi:hypothetical protein